MGWQLAFCVCGVLDGAWAYSASPEKSALSDRLTQHLAGWGIFLDCASKRHRCGESWKFNAIHACMLLRRVPTSTPQRLCYRASAKQRAHRAAPDTATASLLDLAFLYLQHLLLAAAVPPRRGNGTARGGFCGSTGGSEA